MDDSVMTRGADLGVGLSWRPEFAPDLSRLAGSIDFLEIIVDEWGGNLPPANWRSALGIHASVLHSAICSLGSEEASEPEIRMLRSLCRELAPRWVSEHISFSRAGEFEVNNFMPVQYSASSAESLAARVSKLSRSLGRPVAMENTCYFFAHPGNEMTEGEFLARVGSSAVPLMLDVNNLHVNAANFGFDAKGFLRRIAASCDVAYIHVAGHRESDGWLVDSHDEAVSDDVWQLALDALSLTSAQGIVLERDHRSATMDEILEELAIARSVWAKSRRQDEHTRTPERREHSPGCA